MPFFQNRYGLSPEDHRMERSDALRRIGLGLLQGGLQGGDLSMIAPALMQGMDSYDRGSFGTMRMREQESLKQQKEQQGKAKQEQMKALAQRLQADGISQVAIQMALMGDFARAKQEYKLRDRANQPEEPKEPETHKDKSGDVWTRQEDGSWQKTFDDSWEPKKTAAKAPKEPPIRMIKGLPYTLQDGRWAKMQGDYDTPQEAMPGGVEGLDLPSPKARASIHDTLQGGGIPEPDIPPPLGETIRANPVVAHPRFGQGAGAPQSPSRTAPSEGPPANLEQPQVEAMLQTILQRDPQRARQAQPIFQEFMQKDPEKAIGLLQAVASGQFDLADAIIAMEREMTLSSVVPMGTP